MEMFMCSKQHAHTHGERSPHGLMANVLDYDIVINKFELQSHHYVGTNTFGYVTTYPPLNYKSNSITAF